MKNWVFFREQCFFFKKYKEHCTSPDIPNYPCNLTLGVKDLTGTILILLNFHHNLYITPEEHILSYIFSKYTIITYILP